MFGFHSNLHLHHIFPKSLLYDADYTRGPVNAVANFCFLTAECNWEISDDDPAAYLAEIEDRNPGVLKSQWIPEDPELWSITRYLDFLAERPQPSGSSRERTTRRAANGPPTNPHPHQRTLCACCGTRRATRPGELRQRRRPRHRRGARSRPTTSESPRQNHTMRSATTTPEKCSLWPT